MKIDTPAPDGAGVIAMAADLFLPAGNPRTLLWCVPGGGAARGYFDLAAGDTGHSFARRMAAMGHAVVAIDNPGIGESGEPPAPAAFTPRQAGDSHHHALAALRNRIPSLADLPAIAVGHSMGGMLVTLQQARNRSFAAMALLGSSASGLDWALTDEERGYIGDPDGLEAALPRLAEARFGGAFPRFRAANKELAAEIFGGGDPAVSAALRGIGDRMFAAGGVMSMVPGSFAAEAAAIDVPMFLAFGDRDIGVPWGEVPAAYPGAGDITILQLLATGHNHFGFSSIAGLCTRLDHWITAIGRAL
uniref:alpha/beta fold hydrolase n=1 Tax=Edaphosphingomonas laterariae TaxID=861865 RepID=UPI001C533591|nr:alpha/beta fold hydrolase [Sphingomonas laterariae]